MRRKLLGAALVVALAVAAGWNFNQSKNETTLSELTLENMDAKATNESGSNHGRPLLQSTSGAYKCYRCIGTDCGAAC